MTDTAMELARAECDRLVEQLQAAMYRVAWLELNAVEAQVEEVPLPAGLALVTDQFYDPGREPIAESQLELVDEIAEENQRAAASAFNLPPLRPTGLHDGPNALRATEGRGRAVRASVPTESSAEQDSGEPAGKHVGSGKLSYEAVKAAVDRHGGNKAAAARELGCTDPTVHYWLKKGPVGQPAAARQADNPPPAEPEAPDEGLPMRDRVLALSQQGMDDSAIADQLGVTVRQVRKWRVEAQDEDIDELVREKSAQTKGTAHRLRTMKRERDQSQLQKFTEEVVEEDGVKITSLKPGYAEGTAPPKNIGSRF